MEGEGNAIEDHVVRVSDSGCEIIQQHSSRLNSAYERNCSGRDMLRCSLPCVCCGLNQWREKSSGVDPSGGGHTHAESS